ncbi:MAG: ATP-binding protein [Candidatus Omnitrophica bacterium]|nr:ATP-binding protein [Candidatus Omnitrophota bacterium]
MEQIPFFYRNKFEASAIIIALVGPFLWLFDAFSHSLLYHENFLKQIFNPGLASLGLRSWLVFFSLLSAFIWQHYCQLRQRMELLENKQDEIFDSFPDTLFLLNREGRIIKINKTAKQWLGSGSENFLGGDISQFFLEKDTDKIIGLIREVLENGEGKIESITVLDKDKKAVQAGIKALLLQNTQLSNNATILLNIILYPQNITQNVSQSQGPLLDETSKIQQQRLQELRKQIQSEIIAEQEDIFKQRINELNQQYDREINELRKLLEQQSSEGERDVCRSLDESVIRQQEQENARLKIQQLKEEFAKELARQLEQVRRDTEEAVRAEDEKWLNEQINLLETKHSAALQAQIEQTKKEVEEAVRREEENKRKEALDALRANLQKEFEERLEQERQFIEAGVREQEQEKYRNMLLEMEAQFNERMKTWLQQTRQAIEDNTRQQEQERLGSYIKKLEDLCNSLREEVKDKEKILQQLKESQELNQHLEIKIQQMQGQLEVLRQQETKQKEAFDSLQARLKQEFEEQIKQQRQIIESNVRQQEQQKAQQSISQLEQQYNNKIKALEDTLLEVKKNLAQESENLKTKSQPEIILQSVSEGLGTPLSAIINNLKLIKIKLSQSTEEIKPQEFKETINILEENSILLKNILNAFVDPNITEKLVLKPISLNDLVKRIEGLFAKEFKLQSINITKQLRSDLPEIQADGELLFEAIFHIVLNARWAIRALPFGGGAINFTTETTEDKSSVSLKISDTGIGIPKEILPKVFEPFFTTKKEGKGLGLGLTIARNIVQAHKGDIYIESVENKGTTVTIILPVQRAIF